MIGVFVYERRVFAVVVCLFSLFVRMPAVVCLFHLYFSSFRFPAGTSKGKQVLCILSKHNSNANIPLYENEDVACLEAKKAGTQTWNFPVKTDKMVAYPFM